MIYPDELDIFAAFKRAGLIPRASELAWGADRAVADFTAVRGRQWLT